MSVKKTPILIDLTENYEEIKDSSTVPEIMTPSDNDEWIIPSDIKTLSRTRNSRKRKRSQEKAFERKKHRKELLSTEVMINCIKMELQNAQHPIEKPRQSSNSNQICNHSRQRENKVQKKMKELKHRKELKRLKKKNKQKKGREEKKQFEDEEKIENDETRRYPQNDARIPKKWTEEMVKFYFDPVPELENLNLDDELAKMSDGIWNVGEVDRRRSTSSYHNKNFTCKNCNRIGHQTFVCKDLGRKEKHRLRNICWICGTPGHNPNSCQFRVCSRCSNKNASMSRDLAVDCYLCKVPGIRVPCEKCNMWGHAPDNCSDYWRMSAFIVNPGEVVSVTEHKKPASQLCCCNCAKWGHTSEDCKEPTMDQLMRSINTRANHQRRFFATLGRWQGSFRGRRNGHVVNRPRYRNYSNK